VRLQLRLKVQLLLGREYWNLLQHGESPHVLTTPLLASGARLAAGTSFALGCVRWAGEPALLLRRRSPLLRTFLLLALPSQWPLALQLALLASFDLLVHRCDTRRPRATHRRCGTIDDIRIFRVALVIDVRGHRVAKESHGPSFVALL